jgi:hypothetical protein
MFYFPSGVCTKNYHCNHNKRSFDLERKNKINEYLYKIIRKHVTSGPQKKFDKEKTCIRI